MIENQTPCNRSILPVSSVVVGHFLLVPVVLAQVCRHFYRLGQLQIGGGTRSVGVEAGKTTGLFMWRLEFDPQVERLGAEDGNQLVDRVGEDVLHFGSFVLARLPDTHKRILSLFRHKFLRKEDNSIMGYQL